MFKLSSSAEGIEMKRDNLNCIIPYYVDRSVLLSLHPGSEWRFLQVFPSEDFDDVSSRFFTVVCINSR